MNYRPDYNSRFRILKGGKISLVVSALIVGVTLSYAAPSGGVVTSGSASIAQNGSVTNITQSTNKASINWQNFSIATNEAVTFNQPNTSAITLNRVVGNEKSIIDGALNANGQVWILNANGLLFSKNASINTAGLVATTMNLSDTDFQVGNYTFKGDSSASIINQGTINISDKGYAALFGKEVANEGIIKATLGKVHLTGASEITLNLNGNSMLSLTVNKGVLDALVENKGAIYADGGEVYLTTNAVGELLKGVVNNTGIIEANSIDDITGKVELFAHGGEAKIGGSIKAEGGFIETSGKAFSVADGTIVKAKEWLIDPTDITIDNASASAYNTALNNGTDVSIESDTYIWLFAPISKTSGTDATLTLKAGGDILIYRNIASSSGKLNTVLWADADGNGEGRVQIGMGMGASIDTHGGHLWIGGGSGTTTWHGLSVGNGAAASASYNGVTLYFNSFLNSSGGDIFIKGAYTGTLDNFDGVELFPSSINSGAGNIEISGTNSGTGATNAGINSASSITSTTGSITLTGTTANASAYGIYQLSSISSSSGDIALNADRLYLDGGTLASAGKLTIAPTTAGTTIGIAGGSGTLSLPSSYFSTNFHNGFSGITIGSVTAGDITIGGNVSYNDPLTLKTAGNIIAGYDADLTGAVAAADGIKSSLVLWSDADGSGEGRIDIRGRSFPQNSINTNGGHLWMGGGSGSTPWNGLSVGNGAAMSNSFFGIYIEDTVISTLGGNVYLYGKYNGSSDHVRGIDILNSSIATTSGAIDIIATVTQATGADNHGFLSNASITSTTGDITLTGNTTSTSAKALSLYYGNITSTSGDITLNANTIELGSTLSSTGKLTIAPTTSGGTIGIGGATGTLQLPSNYFSNYFANGFSGITIGSATQSGAISIGTVAFNDAVSLYSSGGAIQSGAITGNQNLELLGTGGTYTLTNSGNAIGTLIADTGSVSVVNATALTLGAISATGLVDIATLGGDLTLTGNIATDSTATNAITLNAGKSESAGTTTGGNIIISGGSITTGSGGRALLYTGSYDDSTGLVTLVGSGSGHFRYSVDETTVSFSPTLDSSGIYALYREAQGSGMESTTPPAISLHYTLSNVSQTYNGTTYALSDFWSASSIFGASYSSWVLGSDYVFMYNGTTVTGFKNASTYSNITVDVLKSGYNEASSGNTAGSLIIAPKPLNPSVYAQNKVYDGTTNASISLLSSDIVSGDSVSLSAQEAHFDSKNVGANKPVSISGIALVGQDASNYELTSNSAASTASITPRPLSISASAQDKVYDGTTYAIATVSLNNAIAGDDLGLSDAHAFFNDAHAGVNKVVNVEGLLLEGLDAPNYTLSSTTAQAQATISPRPVSLKADDATKYRYANDPVFGYHFTNGTSLIAGDSLEGSLVREEGEKLGQYTILQGTLTNPDYALGFEEGLFTIMIDPASLIRSTPFTSPKTNVNPTFQEGSAPLFTFTKNGQTYLVFSNPPEGVATQLVGLQELKALLQASDNENMRIPLLEGSLIYLVNGGVRLPDGLEQEFFIAQR